MNQLRILGDGGLGRELADLARAVPEAWEPVLVSASDEDEVLSRPGAVLVGVGDPGVRRAVVARWGALDRLTWPSLVHPTAHVGSATSIGRGAVVQMGAIVTCSTAIGAFTCVNYAVTIGHDVTLGECCLVNPQAHLAGGVTLGDDVLVGAGAVVLEGVVIGAGAIVGAGAVVTRDVAPGTTVVGVPARVMERAS